MKWNLLTWGLSCHGRPCVQLEDPPPLIILGWQHSGRDTLLCRFKKIQTLGMHFGFVVPCIFKYSIKQPARCTFNLKFIALSRIHRSTCFGHCCAHHQKPAPTVFAATGYRMIAGLDVQPGNHTITSGCKGSWRELLMMGTTVPETC
jgi:hypothetical protein